MGAHVPADSEHPVVGQVRPILRFLPENLSYSLAFLQAAEAARLNRSGEEDLHRQEQHHGRS